MQLKVLTYNIHKGFNWSNSTLTVELLKSSLETESPDIVFLQEVVGQNKKLESKHDNWINDQAMYLAKDLWPSAISSKHAIFDHKDHGNVILSKYPIKKSKVIDISKNTKEKRAILFCELEVNGKLLHCYCTHLNLLHRDRVKQYKQIEQEIDKRTPKETKLILAGDFNDWNQKACLHLIESLKINEAHKSLNGEYAKTFPSFFPFFKLDRIYTRGIKIIESNVLKEDNWSVISDHLPILIKGEI